MFGEPGGVALNVQQCLLMRDIERLFLYPEVKEAYESFEQSVYIERFDIAFNILSLSIQTGKDEEIIRKILIYEQALERPEFIAEGMFDLKKTISIMLKSESFLSEIEQQARKIEIQTTTEWMESIYGDGWRN